MTGMIVPEDDRGAKPGRGGATLDPGERAELDRLRVEVLQMRSRPVRTQRGSNWRGLVASLLIVLGCVLAPLSVVAVWTANQVSDTGRYVENVTPLVHDPAIQNALTDKITNAITSQIDVPSYASSAAAALNSRGLPRAAALLQGLGPAIASGLTGFIHGQVHTIVAGPRFASLWVQVNTVAHAQLVKALSGQGNSAIKVTNGQVAVSLGPFIDVVKQRLSARGLTIVNSLPAINPTMTLFSAKYLVKAQTGYRLLNDLKIVLPILALLLLAAGAVVARNHRRAVVAAGLGLAVSMVVLAATLLVIRGMYLSSVPDNKLPADAAAALFDTFVRFIKDGLRVLFAVGLVVAAGAFITGPSRAAVRTRSASSGALRSVREFAALHGIRTGPAGRWTYAHRHALRIGTVALAAIVFVLWGQPTVTVIVVLVGLLLAVLGLIELIGTPPGFGPPAAPQPADRP